MSAFKSRNRFQVSWVTLILWLNAKKCKRKKLKTLRRSRNLLASLASWLDCWCWLELLTGHKQSQPQLRFELSKSRTILSWTARVQTNFKRYPPDEEQTSTLKSPLVSHHPRRIRTYTHTHTCTFYLQRVEQIEWAKQRCWKCKHCCE